MKLIEKNTYGFEDVSLEPHPFSEVYSRKDVSTSFELNNGLILDTPIIASPMADVCDDSVAYAIDRAGGIGCIHRFQSIEEEVNMVHQVVQAHANCFAAVGTTEDFIERASACIEAGAIGIIIDVAFLNARTLQVCTAVRKKFPDTYLISGNVATGAGFRMGVDVGLDAIRVGIGNGQACRTSRVTGVGVGLVTSLMECYEEAVHYQGTRGRVAVICDGGIDVGGSLSKAYAAGAHMAIMGRAFAATHEGPGKGYLDEKGHKQWISEDDVEPHLLTGHPTKPLYKEYRGSASMEAQMVYKKRGEIITSEGVRSLVKVYGSVGDVLGRFNGALRSSMSYLGAKTLADFRSNAIFRLVANGVFNQQKARSLQTCEVTV